MGVSCPISELSLLGHCKLQFTSSLFLDFSWKKTKAARTTLTKLVAAPYPIALLCLLLGEWRGVWGGGARGGCMAPKSQLLPVNIDKQQTLPDVKGGHLAPSPLPCRECNWYGIYGREFVSVYQSAKRLTPPQPPPPPRGTSGNPPHPT